MFAALVLFESMLFFELLQSKLILNDDFEEKLTKCVSSTIKTLFFEEDILTFASNEAKMPELIVPNRFFSIKIQEKLILPYYPQHNFILFSQNQEDLFEIIQNLKNEDAIWPNCNNPTDKVVIVLLSYSNLREIFLKLWELNIINTIIIAPVRENFKLIKANPFDNSNNCGKNIQKFTNILCSETNIKINFLNIPKKLTNCSFKTFLFYKLYIYPLFGNVSNGFSGVLLEPLKLVAERTDLNLIFLEDVGEKIQKQLINNNIYFVDNLIENNTMDYILYPVIAFMDTCNHTISYYHDSYFWVVPKERKLSNVEILAVIFAWSTWIGIIVAISVISICWWYFIKLQNINARNTFVKSLMDMFSLALGYGLKNIPASVSLKALLVAYLIFVIHIILYYQTKLSSLLTRPPFEKGINTIEELIDSNLVVKVLPYLKNRLANSTDAFTKRVYNKLIYRTHGEDYNVLDAIANYRNIASPILKIILEEYHSSKVKAISKTFLVNFDTSIRHRIGDPLIPRIEQLLVYISESGFSVKWSRQCKKIVFQNEMEENTEIVLTFQHLQGSFVILVTGLCLAFLIFLAELFFNETKLWSIKHYRMKIKLKNIYLSKSKL